MRTRNIYFLLISIVLSACSPAADQISCLTDQVYHMSNSEFMEELKVRLEDRNIGFTSNNPSQVCVKEEDTDAVERLMEEMQREGYPPSDETTYVFELSAWKEIVASLVDELEQSGVEHSTSEHDGVIEITVPYSELSRYRKIEEKVFKDFGIETDVERESKHNET